LIIFIKKVTVSKNKKHEVYFINNVL
jgi:hypothetical protein